MPEDELQRAVDGHARLQRDEVLVLGEPIEQFLVYRPLALCAEVDYRLREPRAEQSLPFGAWLAGGLEAPGAGSFGPACPHGGQGLVPNGGVPAGGGQRGVAEVVAEVEVRVVDPDRTTELEGDRVDPLAVARDQVELGLEQRGELLGRQRERRGR